MTIQEFCASTNLTDKQVYTFRDAGLITPDMPASQVEFARLVKALNQKGIKLSQIARTATAGLICGTLQSSTDASCGPTRTPRRQSPRSPGRKAPALQSISPRFARLRRNNRGG
jgi:hypothetical protein